MEKKFNQKKNLLMKKKKIIKKMKNPIKKKKINDVLFYYKNLLNYKIIFVIIIKIQIFLK